MQFFIVNFKDQEACYHALCNVVHPEGLGCPRCGRRNHLHVHRRKPGGGIPDYRCFHCGRVFNAWTNTPFQRTKRTAKQILCILAGDWRGVPRAQLARELHCDRAALSRCCQKWRRWALETFGPVRKTAFPPNQKRKNLYKAG